MKKKRLLIFKKKVWVIKGRRNDIKKSINNRYNIYSTERDIKDVHMYPGEEIRRVWMEIIEERK